MAEKDTAKNADIITLSHPNDSHINAGLSYQNYDNEAAATACDTPPFSTTSSSSSNGLSNCSSSSISSTSDQISIGCNNEATSSPPLRLNKIKVRAENGGLMSRMGLMKLRRQGSQAPSNIKNKQARVLLASLQRLSLNEDIHNSLLLQNDLEGSLVNKRPAALIQRKPELPFSAKIAAAMDADGLIGVEKHISNHHVIAINQAQTQAHNHHHYVHRINSIIDGHSQVSKNRRCELTSGEKGGRRSSIKRRSGWIVLRRLRTSRALFGKIWKSIKRRSFSSSSKRNLHRELLQAST